MLVYVFYNHVSLSFAPFRFLSVLNPTYYIFLTRIRLERLDLKILLYRSDLTWILNLIVTIQQYSIYKPWTSE